MAEIPVVIYWELSPRLIIIPKPTLSVRIPDLYETLKAEEDERAQLDDPIIASAGGGEGLPGGTVALTLTLLNARLGFEQNTDPVASGVITALSTLGQSTTVVQDTGATFLTDGVVAGSVFVDLTSGDSSTIIDVLSETQIRIFNASGGVNRSPNELLVGDQYVIWDVTEGSVVDGNLTAVDTESSPENETIDPIIPTAFTRPLIAQSTALGLVDPGITTTSLAQAVWDEVMSNHGDADSFGLAIRLIETILRGAQETDPDTGVMTIQLGSITLTATIYEGKGFTGQTYRGQGAESRETLEITGSPQP